MPKLPKMEIEKRYKEINELYAQFSLLIIKYDKDRNYKQALKEKSSRINV